MRFDKSSLLNFLIIALIMIGLVGLYDQLSTLGPQGIVTRIATITAKNGLWIGLAIKLLDWLAKQKEGFDKAIHSATDTAQENRETIQELVRVMNELDARLQKHIQELYLFKAESSVSSSLAELRQEVREVQNRIISLELTVPKPK